MRLGCVFCFLFFIFFSKNIALSRCYFWWKYFAPLGRQRPGAAPPRGWPAMHYLVFLQVQYLFAGGHPLMSVFPNTKSHCHWAGFQPAGCSVPHKRTKQCKAGHPPPRCIARAKPAWPFYFYNLPTSSLCFGVWLASDLRWFLCLDEEIRLPIEVPHGRSDFKV